MTRRRRAIALQKRLLEADARRRVECQSGDIALRSSGWEVIRIWEHEGPAAGADRVEAAVSAAQGD